jgi:hypothetical protein
MQVSIHGSYGRPTVRDTLAYQIVVAPWWLAKVRFLKCPGSRCAL